MQTNQEYWKNLVADALGYFAKTKGPAQGSVKSYHSYLAHIERENGGKTLQWLQEAAGDKDPMKKLMDSFDAVFKNDPSYKNLKCALRCLGVYFFGTYKAKVNLSGFDMQACELVARTAIFCSKEVFDNVVKGDLGTKANKNKGNKYGSWDNCTSKRSNVKNMVKQTINGIYLDSNNRPNRYFKQALTIFQKERYGVQVVKFTDYMVCHIWDGSAYDEHYFTSVANIVLLPKVVGGFSDHCETVKKVLKYRAFELFGFKPDNEPEPGKPEGYDSLVWREYVNKQDSLVKSGK